MSSVVMAVMDKTLNFSQHVAIAVLSTDYLLSTSTTN